MRNTKLWSVLFAAVLLCALAVGVLFVGAQAEGTAYKWYVDGVGDDTDCYLTIDAAMAAAKAKTTWAAGDSLTIYVTEGGAATTFNTTNTGGQANSGRNLFNVITVFRADSTKLPITIDGDDPNTEEPEQNSLVLGNEPVWTLSNKKSFSATNDYTFKNLDLSTWGDTSYSFYAGSGMVTFDNVNFGETQTLIITPSVGGWTPFISWTTTQFDTNADDDGLLSTGFTFLNTDYGVNSGTLTCRPSNSGIASDGYTISTGGLVIKNEMLRNKIVIGTGSTVAYVNHHSTPSFTLIKQEPAESIIEVDGGTVTNLDSVAECTGYVGLGNKLITNIKEGTVTNLKMGPGASDGKYTGDIEINWTGGTVTSYKSVTAGTVIGTVTNYAVGIDASNYTANGFNMSGTLSGTLHNIYENCSITGSSARFLGAGGKAPNMINTFKGTFTTDNANLYIGTNGQAISGNITNNIAGEFVTPSGGVVYGGSNSGSVGGTITNNILPGAKITTFISGCNTGSAAAIVNNITGGEIGNLRGAHGINNKTTLESVKSTITGGTITTFQGASSDVTNALITKVENIIGEVKEDGTYSGDATITNFNGGSSEEVREAGAIVNTMYSGTVTNFYGAGTYAITVSSVENHMLGGTVTTYFFGGGNKNKIVGDINNYFYGTTFQKGAGSAGGAYGGSATGAIDGTVTNYYGEKDGDNPICFTKDKHQGMVGGNQASGGTVNKVVNHFENCEFATVTYAGARLGAVNTVENHFYDGFVYSGANFYCGANNAAIGSITNNFYGGSTASTGNNIYCGSMNSGITDGTITNNFLGGKFHIIYGGNVKDNVSGTITNNFGAKDENGAITGNCQIDTFYGGCNTGGTVTTINNNFYAGTLGIKGAATEAATGNTFGGSKAGDVTTINNSFQGTDFLGWIYAGGDTAAVTDIYNNIDVLKNSVFCGNRVGTVANITNVLGVINDVEDDIKMNFCYGASRGGTVTGTISSTINSGTISNFVGTGSVANASFGDVKNIIKGGTIGTIHDGSLNAAGTANSIETTIEGKVTITGTVNIRRDCAGATLTIKEGAEISIGASGKIAVTDIAGAFTLIQTDWWKDSWVYLEGAVVSGKVTVTDNVLGTYTVSETAITGASDLTATNANLILTERVAIRIVYDKPVLETYTVNHLIALVNGAKAKIEIDPKNEKAVIIYGIGLVDFDKEITFAGYLPALDSNMDSIIELSDYAVTQLEDSKIYQAIADFGRVYAGDDAIYGLAYTEVTKTSYKNADPDDSALKITGKNLIMKDALGFRYYATLVGGTTVEDIKVYIDGDDYTNFCNIAFEDGSTTDITIDLYLSIKSMDASIEVKITADGTTALDYVDSGDAIAQKIITAQPDNALAKAALVYIQTAAQM